MVNAILDAACWRGLELVVVFEFEGNGKTVEKIQDPDLGLEFGERWNCTSESPGLRVYTSAPRAP